MENQRNGKAIASLVLGIVSLVFIFFGYGALLGLAMAIVGLVLGIQAKKENPNNGQAKAGVILCIIGLGLCALSFLACVACVGALGSIASSY
ncbi:MAG: putative rane protein [Herbinix sp.]|jgi:membrane-bound ClpP family serine protease|nr:putative rane protein [Herbinix sp.]